MGGAVPNAEVDADGGVGVGAASCVLITMTFWSIKSYTVPCRVIQLFIECPTTRWKLQRRSALYHLGRGSGSGWTLGSVRSDVTLGKTAPSGSTG